MFSRQASRSVSRAHTAFRRTYADNHHPSSNSSSPTEINVANVFGLAALAGISLYFYRNTKNEPVVKTALYNQMDERPNLRNENYLRRYKTSFVKSFIRDKGGIGQKQFRREAQGAVPTILIPTHSPTGPQFGAGIKTADLGPRKERVRFFAPLPKTE